MNLLARYYRTDLRHIVFALGLVVIVATVAGAFSPGLDRAVLAAGILGSLAVFVAQCLVRLWNAAWFAASALWADDVFRALVKNLGVVLLELPYLIVVIYGGVVIGVLLIPIALAAMLCGRDQNAVMGVVNALFDLLERPELGLGKKGKKAAPLEPVGAVEAPLTETKKDAA